MMEVLFFPGLQGQGQGKTGAFTQPAFDHDIPPELFDQAVGDGQAQARAPMGAFGRIKRFKNIMNILFGNTGSRIRDRDDDPLSLLESDTDIQSPPRFHGGKGIVKQI